MSKAEEIKLHIKVVINKEEEKVLFAEAGSDFIDVLLSFLLLPLGTIVEVLEKHYGDETPVVGSLYSLYKGATNLDISHFEDELHKNDLFNKPYFKNWLDRLMINVARIPPTSSSSEKSYDGVFTESAASFIITDNLRVLPNVAGSIFQILNLVGSAAKDMDAMETRNVAFGLNEIIGLLKASLICSNPLTSLIFPERQMFVPREGHVWLHQIDQKAIVMSPEKMILKVMLQKSTNKFLFAQADRDFVNFLIVILKIPLGTVEWFLGSNTGLQNMDNLHKSVADISNNFYLENSSTKNMLVKPNPKIENRLFHENDLCLLSICREGNTYYVQEGVRMFMISDDLTVSELGVTSALSVINELDISLSDIKEVEMKVGSEEGLSILKAALTSPTALTDGLVKPFLKKQELEQQLESNNYRINQLIYKRWPCNRTC